MNELMKATNVGGDDLDTSLLKFMKLIYEQLQSNYGSNITMVNLQACGIRAGLKSIPSQNSLINAYHWNSEPTMEDAVSLHKLVNEEKSAARKAKILNLKDDKHQEEVFKLKQRIQILEGTISAMEKRGLGLKTPIKTIRDTEEFKLEIINAKQELEAEAESNAKSMAEKIVAEKVEDIKDQYDAYVTMLLEECSRFATNVVELKKNWDERTKE